ncbi:hypothetical protein GYMLUDRAFT_238934 [Collybiopsis luxurians FD-317 M1]|nr:hypothetical protein GYMLUDRAFT_238934 [Collybiopsis luxurians FD-317 M1]
MRRVLAFLFLVIFFGSTLRAGYFNRGLRVLVNQTDPFSALRIASIFKFDNAVSASDVLFCQQTTHELRNFFQESFVVAENLQNFHEAVRAALGGERDPFHLRVEMSPAVISDVKRLEAQFWNLANYALMIEGNIRQQLLAEKPSRFSHLCASICMKQLESRVITLLHLHNEARVLLLKLTETVSEPISGEW